MAVLLIERYIHRCCEIGRSKVQRGKGKGKVKGLILRRAEEGDY